MEFNIERKTGTISYKNLDITPMNSEKEKFLFFRSFYLNLTTRIAITIENLDYLISHPAENERLAQYAPAFQNAVIGNFWAQSTIDIWKFFGSNEYSLFNFFNFIKANHKQIFTGVFINTTTWEDGTIEEKKTTYKYNDINNAIKTCEKIIEDNKPLLVDKIKFFRDKVYAHTEKLTEDVHLYITDLKKAFALIDDIINRLFVFYDRTSYVLTPLNSTDVRTICHVIEMYDKYHDLIIEEEKKELHNKLFPTDRK